MTDKPKISVLTTNLNGAQFLQETLDSVAAQTFADFEHVVADGASRDDSVAILERHARRDPRLRWISEPDGSFEEGFHKAVVMARGDYVMMTCVSDGYLSRTWFQRCVDVLDKDRETSLVWGVSALMAEEGDLIDIIPYKYLKRPPPQGRDFFEHWAVTTDPVPELNYCVRRDIFVKHFPATRQTDIDPFLEFLYRFHTNGYLVRFVPVIANFGRMHKGQRSERAETYNNRMIQNYGNKVRQYRMDLIGGRKRHAFRDGDHREVGELTRAGLLRLRYVRTAGLVHRVTGDARRMVARLQRSVRKRIKKRRA